MKKLFYILITISLFHQCAGAQWVQQVSGTGTTLLDIEFINQNTGWVCGDGGTIIKTTNGGINWVTQYSGVPNKPLYGIHPVNENVVYCVGWFETILKTTDGGNNWLIIRNGPSGMGSSFFEVFFLNENTGWLIKNFYILRTTNGGNTFDSTNVIYSYLKDIHFKEISNGILCGDGALIMKTSNGGINWVQVPIPLYDNGQPDFFKQSFVGDYGWVAARSSESTLGRLIYRTTNFGSSWDTIGRVPFPAGTETYCVSFSSQSTGWCGGTLGLLYKSTNGGFNWVQQITPSNAFHHALWLYNDTIGWSTGGLGQILKTTTGGQYVSVTALNQEVPEEFNLKQNYPNPFNSQTVIKFEITESGYYNLDVFDVLGRKVNEVFSKQLKQGVYEIDYNAGNLSTGTYLYRLFSEKQIQVRKFILIK